MIIYGWRDKVIKTYEDSHIKCKECGSYSQVFIVLQSYFHIFWIPFFPLGRKKVVCQCVECEDASNTERLDHYRSVTRTPFYLFTGVLLIAGFLLVSMWNVYREKSYLKQCVQNPRVGDVFMLETEAYEDKTTYHFMKLTEVTPDTLFMIMNAYYYYKKSIDEIDPDDYFISNDRYYILTNELEEYRREGSLKKVFRDYPLSSTFHYEQEIEFDEEEGEEDREELIERE